MLDGPRAAASKSIGISHATSSHRSRGFIVTNIGEIEVQVKIVKVKHRVIEHNLPYVMCHAIVIACILYTMPTLNYVVKRINLDGISLFETFTNKKIEQNKYLSLTFGSYFQVTNRLGNNSPSERTQSFSVFHHLRTADLITSLKKKV